LLDGQCKTVGHRQHAREYASIITDNLVELANDNRASLLNGWDKHVTRPKYIVDGDQAAWPS